MQTSNVIQMDSESEWIRLRLPSVSLPHAMSVFASAGASGLIRWLVERWPAVQFLGVWQQGVRNDAADRISRRDLAAVLTGLGLPPRSGKCLWGGPIGTATPHPPHRPVGRRARRPCRLRSLVRAFGFGLKGARLGVGLGSGLRSRVRVKIKG